jgi:eukaryotic-like serine/threonine-protein kinase
MDRRTIGPFLLEEQIGVGGMGVVYRATYPKNNKQVAVKILAPGLINDKKLLSRFEREIKILKRLDHPNIVKYYGGGTENNQRYYAMQFINGGSLQDVMKKRGRLSWEQAIHVGRQVCSALEHAHNAGIIHRDLKPANLFLSSKGRLMLGDFGIARDTEATALTAAGKTVGTYAYMAPEQINGAHPICGKTDLYALGCLMYEILVGETPFVSDNPAEMLMQHINDDPHNVSEFAPDCPVWLDKLVDRMLAKDPDDRPYDALAVHTELGEIRDRIAEGNSVAAANTLPGGQMTTRDDNTRLQKALKKKKKKKRKDVPLHERTSFLAACLSLLIVLTVYLSWPESVESMHTRIAPTMEAGRRSEKLALRDDISDLLTRDPEGPFAADAKSWLFEIDLGTLKVQMEKRGKGYGDPKDRYEKWYVAAFKAEQDLDANPLAAVERYYEAVRNMHQEPETEPSSDAGTPDKMKLWTVLFRESLNSAKKNVLNDIDVRKNFHARMEQAERLFDNNSDPEALDIWEATAANYQNIDKVADFQHYASRRYNGKSWEIPPANPEQPTPDSDPPAVDVDFSKADNSVNDESPAGEIPE